jgi:hypothetical protein
LNRCMLCLESRHTQGNTMGLNVSPSQEPCRTGFARSYHVDWNGAQDRWDVVDDDGRVHGHCHNLEEATDLAIREAHHDHAAGKDVIVCVEQEDGGYTMAWSSR